MSLNRDAAAIVLDRYRAIGMDRHLDGAGKARHYLVNTVIDDLLDQMMQTALVRRADVHARTYTDGFQAFENLNILFTIASIPVISIASAALQVVIFCHLAQQSLALMLYLFCH